MPRQGHAAAALLIFLILAGLPVAAQEDYSNYPPDIRRIKERGALIVAMHSSNFRPYMFADPDNPEHLIGHEIDLARDIAAELGVELILDREAQSFDGVPHRVADRHADVGISLLTRTLARAQFVRFTIPYMVERPTIAIHRINSSVFEVDLNNPVASLRLTAQTVAEPAGNAYVTIAQDIFPNVELVELPSWADVYQAVLDRTVTFALRSEVGVANFLYENKEQQINLQTIPLDEPRYEDRLAMAVHPDDIHLLHWLNVYIQDVHGTITGQDLLAAYAEYYE